MKTKPKYYLLDVDGILNNGQFIYSNKGKVGKIFGPDDNDALKILSQFINISFISSDYRGYEISKKRVQKDMGFKINLVRNHERSAWIEKNFDLKKTIFMGDGIFDWITMKKCFYSISCHDSSSLAKKYSKFITKSNSGNRSVSEASFHIIKKFFYKDKIEKLIISYLNESKKKT